MSNTNAATPSDAPPPPLKASPGDGPCTTVAARKQKSLGFLPRSSSADNVLRSLKSKTRGRMRASSASSANQVKPLPQEVSLDSDDDDLWEAKGKRRLLIESAIDLEDERTDSDISSVKEDKDIYRWAVLYENQRGFTDAWSDPHYSCRTLLPNDPLPFTVPIPKPNHRNHRSNEAKRKAMKTPCTLRDYQLPDARWRWVSKHWMVDMRRDEVSKSGFEYNWAFRSKGWRPDPGPLSMGGWVRRRRWVRLMVRPAEVVEKLKSNDGLTPISSRVSLPSSKTQRSLELYPSRSSSRLGSRNEMDSGDDASSDMSMGTASAFGNTWRGEVHEDWERVRRVMKYFGRDGKRLEMWRDWLGAGIQTFTLNGSVTPESPYINSKSRKMANEEPDGFAQRNATDSSSIDPRAIPDRECIIAVLQKYGTEILSLFVFPSSRASFLDLLDEADINRQIVGDQLARSYGSHADQLTTKDKVIAQ